MLGRAFDATERWKFTTSLIQRVAQGVEYRTHEERELYGSTKHFIENYKGNIAYLLYRAFQLIPC
jgi:hypothetical protein